MKAALVRLIPERRLLVWLAIAVAVAFAFCIGGAAGLGFDAVAIENGPQENFEIAFLIGAAVFFLACALPADQAGAPVMVFLALVFGLMGLREFETPDSNAFLIYLASHAARIHWAILCAAVLAWVAWRDRRFSLRQHLSASGPVWVPLISAAVIVVLGSLAEEAATNAVSPHTHDIMEWLEETLEVCGYVVALTTSVWMARIRFTPQA